MKKFFIILVLFYSCNTAKKMERTFESVSKIQDRVIADVPRPVKDSIIIKMGKSDTLTFVSKSNDTVSYHYYHNKTDTIVHYQTDNNKVEALVRLEFIERGKNEALNNINNDLKGQIEEQRLFLGIALLLNGVALGVFIRSKFS